MKPIENLLRQIIGLDAASIGSTLIERVVRLRMKRLSVENVEEYRRLIQSSAQERTELIEAVVVTETWFFRDREPFSVFVRLVQQEWLPVHPGGVLRVLSVPCASGEEPYSLAMALLDAGLPPDGFQIEGIDISSRALECAERAVYGKNSFRGEDLAFRSRHFRETKEGYALDPAVRRRVWLHRGNLLGDDFMTGSANYDFVFCRNLLIYFDSATQRTAFEKLGRLLAPGGILFVGPAEIPLALENGFASTGIPMAFACWKLGAAAAGFATSRTRAARAAKFAPTYPAPLPARLPREQFLLRGGPGSLPQAGAPRTVPVDLALARTLADRGNLKEAAEICQAYLRRHGPSAQAYFLLGLMHDATGHTHAADYYRKALYLQPDHYETLWQMALLSQKNGDLAQARAFKRRAQRAQQKNDDL